MINRRLFISAAAFSSGIGFAVNKAGADYIDFSLTSPWKPDGDVVPTLEEYQAKLEANTGPDNPFKSERELAIKLLEDIPSVATPYGIAQRFHLWRTRRVPNKTAAELEDYSYYAREWPIRGNPVIMGFFDATGYRKPKGDTTFWCSAFVSWCIQRSQQGKGTMSTNAWPYNEGAASQAYASWGKDVEKDLGDKPRKGDLVVFRQRRNPTAGHIGFYHGELEDGTLLVLGGNQGAQNEYNGGEVNISTFTRDAAFLRFHSFRRFPELG
jgi:uncharacterized protein (TIGR02594 family)